MSETVKEYLARIGRKGGKATGETKARGGKTAAERSTYYSALRAKGVRKARRARK
jgi:hypothetical protein